MTFNLWLTYLLTDLLLSFTPGPAVLCVSSQAIKYGAKSSYFTSMGICTGNLVYYILSALGLSAMILTYAFIFNYIKLAGAIYLLGMGILMIFASLKKKQAKVVEAPTHQKAFKSFLIGFITQASNPKAIIFFVALLPQFVNPNGNILVQFLILGATNISTEIFILMAYGRIASRSKHLSNSNSRLPKRIDRLAGSILIGLGINLLLMSNDIKK